MPELALSIPTFAAITSTVAVSISLPFSNVVGIMQTIDIVIQTPAAAVIGLGDGYSFEIGNQIAATSVSVAAPALSWLAIVNPTHPYWSQEGTALWAIWPLVGPILPIFGYYIGMFVIRFGMWVFRWFMRLLELARKLIELIPFAQ
jgi:hypothetical protein